MWLGSQTWRLCCMGIGSAVGGCRNRGFELARQRCHCRWQFWRHRDLIFRMIHEMRSMHVPTLLLLWLSGYGPVILGSVTFLGHTVDVLAAGKWDHFYPCATWLSALGSALRQIGSYGIAHSSWNPGLGVFDGQWAYNPWLCLSPLYDSPWIHPELQACPHWLSIKTFIKTGKASSMEPWWRLGRSRNSKGKMSSGWDTVTVVVGILLAVDAGAWDPPDEGLVLCRYGHSAFQCPLRLQFRHTLFRILYWRLRFGLCCQVPLPLAFPFPEKPLPLVDCYFCC